MPATPARVMPIIVFHDTQLKIMRRSGTPLRLSLRDYRALIDRIAGDTLA